MKKALTILAIFSALFFCPRFLVGHCDTIGGPVIKAAQRALDSANLNIVLIWVKKEFEPELRQAFTKALAVRQLNSEARELADMYFFETVVRLHRMGEGASFTGLKPAGEIDPIILASDRALEQGNAKELVRTLTQTVQENVHKHFKELLVLKKFPENDVAAGRKFVEAYVSFTHSIEKIYQAATGGTFPHEAGH